MSAAGFAPGAGQSVVQPWLAEACSLKMQTVLLCALRGCDGVPKEDPSKPLVRSLRAVVLFDADPGSAFRQSAAPELAVIAMAADLDHYPVHWLFHFMHAAEIVGYRHPDQTTAARWRRVYEVLIEALHVGTEPPAVLAVRLGDRPAAAGEVAS